ncbi:hypothetical protein OG342_04945 [Streptomyces bobili]|uniref:hypothetical protein n=1 Tax=Streptomyces bobili TaxID=67280 RepID=UPI00224FCA78|nr:hypothetical protein [Streptomyces bobili]MCX5522215.1 hypothetical protein [Streptomyces bobili]
MSKLDARPLSHQVSYERGVLEKTPAEGWRERVPAPDARASCTCGQLDTGLVGPDEAWRAAQEHVKRYLPGVGWGPDIDGPERPVDSEEKTG